MHDGDDHRSVEEGYDKAGDQNKYDNNKNEKGAKNWCGAQAHEGVAGWDKKRWL